MYSSGTPSPGKGAHSDFLLSPLRTLLDSIVPPSTFPPYPGVPGFLRNIKGTRSPPKFFCYPFTLVPGFLLRMSPKFLPLLSNTSPISQVPEKAWRARSPSWTSFVTDTHTHTHTHWTSFVTDTHTHTRHLLSQTRTHRGHLLSQTHTDTHTHTHTHTHTVVPEPIRCWGVFQIAPSGS